MGTFVKRLIIILLCCSILGSGFTSKIVTFASAKISASSVQKNRKKSLYTRVRQVKDSSGDQKEKESVLQNDVISTADKTIANGASVEDDIPNFNSLGDAQLLQYMKDSIYAKLTGEFASEDYIIESIDTVYYSKEYLEEFAYNSRANIFFGYTLAELDEQFQGARYVFTLGENGKTVVEPFADYDDTYDRVIKNIAIGTGVILTCVTVSAVTTGAPISIIFAASAKTGAIMALSSGTLSAVAAGTIKGIETGDMSEAAKVAALTGSEAFKWGAITGAIRGGVDKANVLRNAPKTVNIADNTTIVYDGIPTWRESELAALKKYGGREQVSFLGGIEVPKSTPGSTRPDILRTVGNHLEAIEVKNYDLSVADNRSVLYSELVREVSARITNLPDGSTQRIVLDVTGRGFSSELITEVMEQITLRLIDIYPNIPIEIMGAIL